MDEPKTFTHPFGQADKAKEAKPVNKTEAVRKADEDTDKKSTSNVNEDVWAEAERSARDKGAISGEVNDGNRHYIQEQYDQMIQNDKNLKAWAGKDSEILGDAK